MFLPSTPRTIPLRLLLFAICCIYYIAYGLYLALFFCCLVIVGSLCNGMAMYMNGWKMPVVTNDPVLMNQILTGKTHDLAHNFTKVRLLCDIIKIRNYYISVGDIICLAGMSGIAMWCTIYIIYRL